MKKYLSYILLIVVCVAVLYGIRSWRMNKALESIEVGQSVNGLLVESVNWRGENYIIPPNQIHDSGLTAEELPSINNPQFTSVIQADKYLADTVEGVSLEIFGEQRFYSYQILNWHIVVNDETIAITHCPLCKSARVYRREVNGEKISLQANGELYNNNHLLSDDSTDGLWLQGTGVGISGENIGLQLEEYPYEIMSWSAFKEAYPSGSALSTETGYTRDYTSHPYGSYDKTELIFFPVSNIDSRMPSKWDVTGLNLDGVQLAFADSIMLTIGVANETVLDQGIVAFYDFEEKMSRVFRSSVFEAPDQTSDNLVETKLTFSYAIDTLEITDDQTESVWNTNGKAVSGELKGRQLERLSTDQSFWMCWSSQYPETEIPRTEKELEPESTEEVNPDDSNE